jgi:hypothetical protein
MVLTCRAAVAHLTDDQPAPGLRLHLAICRDCGRYLQQLTAVRAALGALRGPGVGGEAAEGEGGGQAVSPRTRALLAARFRAWRATLPGRRP